MKAPQATGRQAKPKADSAREARLAKALRDNLRRRKAGEKEAAKPEVEE
jgi:hypothetical protein